jgi:general secretion pathway protein D
MPLHRYIIRSFLFISISLQTSCATAPWPDDKVKGKNAEEKIENAKENHIEEDGSVETLKILYATQEQEVNKLLIEGEIAFKRKYLEEAMDIYQRILRLSHNHPKAMFALAEIEQFKKHTQKVQEAESLYDQQKLDEAKQIVHEVLLENPEFVDALIMSDKIQTTNPQEKAGPPTLVSKNKQPITLNFRDANIKVVFEALSNVTGINFILDSDIKNTTKATVFIKNASVEEAIETVLSSNGLLKKNLTDKSALVYPNLKKKTDEYQELMVRNFYITNTTAARIADMLRAVLKVKDVYVDDRINMLVVRDTPEVIRVAEKMVAANDLPDPEVMLDLEIIEINRSRLQELGINYPSQLSISNRSTVTLEALLNDVTERNTIVTSYNGISPSLIFRKTTGDINILSNPRIRVKNNEKAHIEVGDKIPLITTTVVSGNATSSAQSIQYLDVGLKLDIQPKVSIDNYVNIQLGLQVNSLGNQVTTINGAPVFQIGSRNANTVLRLKDGETQILGGLISDDERESANKLPGLGDIPFLGRLFSNNSKNKQKTEIVLVVTPHIISNIKRPEAKITEHWTGTDTHITDKPLLSFPSKNHEKDNQISRSNPVEETKQEDSLSEQPPIIEAKDNDANKRDQVEKTTTNIDVTPSINSQPSGAFTQDINSLSKPIQSIELDSKK